MLASKHLGPVGAIIAQTHPSISRVEHIFVVAWREEPPAIGGLGAGRSHIDVFSASRGYRLRSSFGR